MAMNNYKKNHVEALCIVGHGKRGELVESILDTRGEDARSYTK